MKKIILPLLTAALLLPTLTAHATYRAEKRQDARDIRQDARQSGREEKRECVRNDDKSNMAAATRVMKSGNSPFYNALAAGH